MTRTRMEVLQYIPYIYYLVLCKQDSIYILINSSSEANIMTLAHAKKLGIQVRKTDVDIQKYDSTTLVTHEIVVANIFL